MLNFAVEGVKDFLSVVHVGYPLIDKVILCQVYHGPGILYTCFFLSQHTNTDDILASFSS